ncbi:MAG: hypothetical protein MI723_17770, partial [Caulobacterales bacterium]|nr:hypothetical protein [Caulobacterales bacterium]
MSRKTEAGGIVEAFTSYEAAIRALLRRYFRTHHDVEDLTQEVFIRAYRAESGKDIEDPKAYLFG